jgi:uncharacterized membrane protein YphA (DoxX/SURF4 family)
LVVASWSTITACNISACLLSWLSHPLSPSSSGGILVLVGLFTRCGALAILIDMLIAIWKVHWRNGLFAEHGYEFPLTLAAVAFTLMCYAAGPLAFEILRSGKSSA